MRGSRKFCLRGSNLYNDFLFFCFFSWWGEGGSKPSTTIAGHHRPASETPLNGVSLACPWWPNTECWLGSCDFQEVRTCSARKPNIFVNFQGVRTPCSPSLWIRTCKVLFSVLLLQSQEPPSYQQQGNSYFSGRLLPIVDNRCKY